MKTFETEKYNIPEGATHYVNETNEMHFAWKHEDGKYQAPSVSLEWLMFSPIREWIPIPQNKEVEWVNGDFAIYEGSIVMVIAYHPKHPVIVVETSTEEYINVGICDLSKPETEAERVERERLEAAYDLYLDFYQDYNPCHDTIESFDCSRDKDLWLRTVDKTNYRKESE